MVGVVMMLDTAVTSFCQLPGPNGSGSALIVRACCSALSSPNGVLQKLTMQHYLVNGTKHNSVQTYYKHTMEERMCLSKGWDHHCVVLSS